MTRQINDFRDQKWKLKEGRAWNQFFHCWFGRYVAFNELELIGLEATMRRAVDQEKAKARKAMDIVAEAYGLPFAAGKHFASLLAGTELDCAFSTQENKMSALKSKWVYGRTGKNNHMSRRNWRQKK